MSNSDYIIRAYHGRENPYVIVARSLLEDRRLSWKAKGLMAYLLSRPDGWDIREQDLINRGPDGIGDEKSRGAGRGAIRAALRELEAAGYLARLWFRPGGKFGQRIFVVVESPELLAEAVNAAQAEISRLGPVSPSTHYPSTDDPSTDNALLNIKTRSNKRRKTTTKNEGAPAADAAPAVVVVDDDDEKNKDLADLLARYGVSAKTARDLASQYEIPTRQALEWLAAATDADRPENPGGWLVACIKGLAARAWTAPPAWVKRAQDKAREKSRAEDQQRQLREDAQEGERIRNRSKMEEKHLREWWGSLPADQREYVWTHDIAIMELAGHPAFTAARAHERRGDMGRPSIGWLTLIYAGEGAEAV